MTLRARLPRIAAAACAIGAVALLALLAAGPGHRFDLWHYSVSFAIMRYAAYAGIVAALLSLLTIALERRASRVLALSLAGFALGAFTAWLPWQQLQTARRLPPIHDISTDTERPPEFFAVLPLRAEAPNSTVYEGATLAAQQRQAYPDIQPLLLDLPPADAFVRALDAAHALGWEIVAHDQASGHIEATETTFWFGFKDDVVVRIAPDLDGSRVDVRSVSRVGKSDLGANAARIRLFLRRMQRS